MSKRLSLCALPLMAMLSFATLAHAEDSPTASTVVATVNGTDITIGHMMLVHRDLPQQYRQLPPDVLFKGILDQLVHQTLLEETMKGSEPKRVELAVSNLRRSLLASDAVEAIVAAGMSEEAIKKAYEEKYAKAEPSKEYHAAHILVEAEGDAISLVEELKGGADFAALAKKHSTGPSGPSGGDLGWFGTGRMVPEFESAVVALEPGAVSAPVKTKFGWHVIKLMETRLAEAPKFDAVRAQIEGELRNELVDARIEELKKAAKIDMPDEKAFDPAILGNAALLEK
ncbi:peptidylprolyl isomerase [Rhodobacteraceae bacterium D3-12]|nr:peptidylprolyl isomerase [Rhodobacteraceae bacterium D3-12]